MSNGNDAVCVRAGNAALHLFAHSPSSPFPPSLLCFPSTHLLESEQFALVQGNEDNYVIVDMVGTFPDAPPPC